MKANYTNEDIGVSKEAFEKPENLSINVDCNKIINEMKDDLDTEDDLDDLDF